MLAAPLSCKNSVQVVHTHVPLSTSSIIWYWQCSDAMQLERSHLQVGTSLLKESA